MRQRETERDRDRKNRHLLVFTEHLFYARCVETTRDRVKQTERKAAKDNERDVDVEKYRETGRNRREMI